MKKYMALPILALLLLTVSASAGYHGKKGWYWWENETTVKEVGVTPEQMTKINEIQAKHNAALEKAVATYKKKEKDYWTVKSDPKASNADVIKAFDVMWNAKYKMKRIDLDTTLDVRAVLTPEQVTKLNQIREEHIKKMQEKWIEKKENKQQKMNNQ